MNTLLKTILIIINIVMLVIAILWLRESKEWEPLIVCLGQGTTILTLFFERQASKIFTKDVVNTKINIKNRNGDGIHSEKIKDSDIRIS